jgi:hypothetical protein
MKRWLLRAMAVLSLTATPALAGLWVLGHRRWDYLGLQAGTRALGFQTTRPAVLDISWNGVAESGIGVQHVGSNTWPLAGSNGFDHPAGSFLGVGWGTFGRGSPVQAWVRLPLWLPVLLAAGLASISVRASWREFRRGRSAAGRCRSCGYDLRGSEGKSCPECGSERPA